MKRSIRPITNATMAISPGTVRAAVRSARLRLRSEQGLTLIELLTVSLMMVVVMVALAGLYRVSIQQQQDLDSQTHGLVSEKNGLEKMSREIRQAESVCSTYPTCGTSFSNSATIDIQTYSGSSTLIWVRYNCSGTPAQASPPALTTRACLRSQATTAGGLGSSPAVLIGNVALSPAGIFSFTAPGYVTISLPVKVRGLNNPITLHDGVRTRNA